MAEKRIKCRFCQFRIGRKYKKDGPAAVGMSAIQLHVAKKHPLEATAIHEFVADELGEILAIGDREAIVV